MTLLYAAPGIFALAGKILIFWLYRHSIPKISRWFLAFIGFMFCLNIAELAILSNPNDDVNGYIYVVLFYAFALLSTFSLLGFTLELNGWLSRLTLAIPSGLLLAALIALAIPDAAMTGVESIGYSLTRIAGEYYWILQITLLCYMLTVLGLLIYSTYKSHKWQSRARALAVLVAFVPGLIVTSGVIIAMQYNVQINATVIISICSTFMIAVMIYTETIDKLQTLVEKIPGTCLYKAEKKFKAAIGNQTSLKDAGLLFEGLIAKKMLAIHNGDKAQLVKKLGVSETTINRRLKLFDDV